MSDMSNDEEQTGDDDWLRAAQVMSQLVDDGEPVPQDRTEQEQQSAAAANRLLATHLLRDAMRPGNTRDWAARQLREDVHRFRYRISGTAWREAASALENGAERHAALDLLGYVAQVMAEEVAMAAALVHELRAVADEGPALMPMPGVPEPTQRVQVLVDAMTGAPNAEAATLRAAGVSAATYREWRDTVALLQQPANRVDAHRLLLSAAFDVDATTVPSLLDREWVVKLRAAYAAARTQPVGDDVERMWKYREQRDNLAGAVFELLEAL